MRKLGGWWRLWIVTSAVWFLGCMLVLAGGGVGDGYYLIEATSDMPATADDDVAKGELITLETIGSAIANAEKAGDRDALETLLAYLKQMNAPIDAAYDTALKRAKAECLSEIKLPEDWELSPRVSDGGVFTSITCSITRNGIEIISAVAIVPPILLLLSGLAFSWIRAGFGQRD